MLKKKVLLGMSGGVDSAVAALLLLKQGYEVTGVTMKLRPDKYMSESSSGGCCSLDDIDDARRVAYKLGIDHLVLNFTEAFNTDVINYFVQKYLCGRTPNPCIACNQKIKFDALLKKALLLGYDHIATGHYAAIEYDNQLNRWLLKKANSKKDQSYVLYGMQQYQLAHTLMPLSNIEKSEVRELAHKYDLPVAKKPDSQEICFVQDKNYAKFIEQYTGKSSPRGCFMDEKGVILGHHSGITKYTIGQRKGLGIAFGEPRYVTKIDASKNTIVLGKDKDQYSDSLIAKSINFIPFSNLHKKINISAKIRYQAKPAEATLIPINANNVRVEFKVSQKAVTPGQSVVFYDGNLVIGGGVIEESTKYN
ncbi:MAG: tRNA 2-thiouridine(34) synthase MnmA [Oscillospiraceae bacterium]|jgi:tRNA-specific 2-thiouridylase|nr:tRNA 2-thiouridine(34) synthase MnmA [Oscillospiraceae bacterium]